MWAPGSDEEAPGHQLSMGASLGLASMGFILLLAGSIDTKWMVLEKANGEEPMLISPWLVCIKKNCSREYTTVDLRVTQTLMVTALCLSLLLALGLVLAFLQIIPWLEHHHLTMAILSFLTVFFLLLALLIFNRRMKRVYRKSNKITILWPCYTLWVCLVLFLSSGVVCCLNYRSCRFRAQRSSAVAEGVQIQLSREASVATVGSSSQISQGLLSTASTAVSTASSSLPVPRSHKASRMVLQSPSGLTALPF
ncbi:outer dense fiber protein 4-like isoform X1 [Ornithorhynchus anatinus]|uniref:outer dense fiber protein 4-like isoform X1 n=1 Tax=Ornithorhynchus anatinus TaxID=9258 RepID=UPI0010A8D52C|nr:outer dense fiber protein 4-like isoform X1 [Ornithorhynchus anatinus]XP_028930513.1 outer dense fiber protein 4-like isoform X1 [Ornithorhynchus anatinus]XP_028930514.1 outer dense fiber protein 4-like isoform X1 [Ornithorhynchus anatinus]